MSLLVLGTTALDSIKTPAAERHLLLGGSGSYAAVAASFFSQPHLVGAVGQDFPVKYLALYRRRGIDLRGLQHCNGKTFFWSGEYELDLNRRRTLQTQLGVIRDFQPVLPEAYRHLPFVLLANISPTLQAQVLDQMRRPRFVTVDTMDLWLNIALPALKQVLKRVDCLVLNDGEARQLAGCDNLFTALPRLHRLGPKIIIIKKGEHGAICSAFNEFFLAPAYPLRRVVDPTGAGDVFVGGFMGYLAARSGGIRQNIRAAILHGAALASFCCEGFGLNRLVTVRLADIHRRVQQLSRMTSLQLARLE